MSYKIDFKSIEKFLGKSRGKRVLIEAPPGLWKEAVEIADRYSLEISSLPVFGSCLIFEFLDYDAFIHLGHSPYPFWRPKKEVLYIEAEADLEVKRSLEALKGIKGSKVVVGSVQHKTLILKVAKELNAIVLKPSHAHPGQILGCDFRAALTKADNYIVVAGGRFHYLGLSLFLFSRGVFPRIWHLDPYRDEVKEVTEEGLRLYKKRLWKVEEAKEANSFAIINGIEGQNRLYLGKYIDKKLRELGKKTRWYKSIILRRDDVIAILEENDFAIVLSCPRLIDDFEDLNVLAPGEVRALWDSYHFPW